jgi:hypothetical protein
MERLLSDEHGEPLEQLDLQIQDAAWERVKRSETLTPAPDRSPPE